MKIRDKYICIKSFTFCFINRYGIIVSILDIDERNYVSFIYSDIGKKDSFRVDKFNEYFMSLNIYRENRLNKILDI